MQSIAMLGSEEQKQRWLPGMARLDKLGAFRAPPSHCTDPTRWRWRPRPAAMGDHWVLNGAKKWIGKRHHRRCDRGVGSRHTADGKVKGFLVEKGTPGYDAKRIVGKGSLRSVWQAEIILSDVRVPDENRLPGARSFKDAGRVLAGTRNAVAWGALGHATARVRVRRGLLAGSGSSSASRW